MKKLVLLFLALGLGLPACASMRGVDVGTDTSSSYAVVVENDRSSSVNISYVDGDRTIALGSVPAGEERRFIIGSPSSTSITLTARSSAGTVVGTHDVVLTGGSTMRVTVR